MQCGSQSFYELRSNNNFLCKKHFQHFFLRRVKRNVRKSGILSAEDDLIVCVDGRYSLIALKILRDIIEQVPGKKIKAVAFSNGGFNEVFTFFCGENGFDFEIIDLTDIGFDKMNSPTSHLVWRRICKNKTMEYAVGDGISMFCSSDCADDVLAGALASLCLGEIKLDMAKTLNVAEVKMFMGLGSDELNLYAEILGVPDYEPYVGDNFFSEIVLDIECEHPGSKNQMMHSMNFLENICPGLDNYFSECALNSGL